MSGHKHQCFSTYYLLPLLHIFGRNHFCRIQYGGHFGFQDGQHEKKLLNSMVQVLEMIWMLNEANKMVFEHYGSSFGDDIDAIC